MGVLDDAIKEHLELKRKHGAAEDELQRQEEEALGPARRDVAQQPEGDAEPHEEAAESAAAAQDTALFDGEDAEAPEVEHVDPTVIQPPEAVEPTPVEPPPVTEEAALPEEPASPEEPALSEEPPVAGKPPVGQEPDIGSHQPDEPDPRDARLGDTQPHGFDALEEDEPEEDEALPGDEADPADGDADDEDQDVLEDTPDFLQETPEHDRLWFEQKPPRDFDFD